MKQLKLFILTIVCLITMAACSSQPVGSEDQASSQLVSTALAPFVSASEWPEDDFTNQVTKPEFGTVNSVSSATDYTSVHFTDSSISQVEKYVEALKQKGFDEISRIKEKVNTGSTEYSGAIVLKHDDLYVNITYLDYSFGILIHKNIP